MGSRFILIVLLFSVRIAPAMGQTTAMTFNIRYDNPNDGDNAWNNRKTEVIAIIKNHAPDLIGIQEALPNQVNDIRENLEEYRYIGHGRDGINTNSEATPIFYNYHKFDLLGQKLFWLSKTPGKISKGWDASLNRIAVYGKFRNKETGELLHVINTHFDHRGKRSRKRSAELLLKFLRVEQLLTEKVILLGDLNAAPSDKPIEVLKKELSDAREIAIAPADGPEGTFNGFNADTIDTHRIDYIFVKNLEIKTYRCLGDKRENGLYPSDHFPVTITF